MNKQYSPKTIIESHKVYSKFYNDKISITLSYAGGAQPYCTHLKIYEDKKIGVFDMIYGDYFCNLFEAMDSFKIMNPNYDIRFYSGQDCVDYINKYYSF